MGVSRQGYDAWRKRAQSARVGEDEELTALIVSIDTRNKGRYGIDRIHRELARQGHRHSPKRVRRLARAAGLRCVHPRPYKATTVQSVGNPLGLVDLLDRAFVADRPDEIWYGDITYIEAYSRRMRLRMSGVST
jgi:putative transposase